MRLYVGGDSSFHIQRTAANNTIRFFYKAGGITVEQITGGITSVNFVPYAMTWDISAGATGEVRYYIDGVASGATDTGLGTWAGNLNPGATCVGASTTGPTDIWSGNVAPVSVWSAALSPDEMRYLG